jgi:hypothetical protein
MNESEVAPLIGDAEMRATIRQRTAYLRCRNEVEKRPGRPNNFRSHLHYRSGVY